MSPNNKEEEEHRNPLFENTQTFSAAPGWSTPTPNGVTSTTIHIQKPPLPSPESETRKKHLPEPKRKQGYQPSTHDMSSEIPYNDRHKKINGMLDKRLLPYWNAIMRDKEYGSSMTMRFNRMIMIFLLAENYEVNPSLLDEEFTWEDLPRE